MNTPHNNILSANELNEKLAKILPSCQSLVIISAYITKPAIDWLNQHIISPCSVILVGRLLPSDFSVGASNISALRAAISFGWTVKHLPALHAKIYLCNKELIFIGSANFTTNGLKIFGQGNIEGCVEIPAEPCNTDFIYKLVNESEIIDDATVDKMESYIQSKNMGKHKGWDKDFWPKDIIQLELKVWVCDFPWINPKNCIDSDEADIEHDRAILGVDHLSAKDTSSIAFKNSKVFNWLVQKISSTDSKELYFGKLTSILHEEIRDDPTPYRKDIKGLLSNLLLCCQEYASDSIKVDRPLHSQRITLL